MKHTLKLLAILLALALLLVGCGNKETANTSLEEPTATEAATEAIAAMDSLFETQPQATEHFVDTPQVSTPSGSFDPDLVGRWDYVDLINNGDYKLIEAGTWGANLCFLPNGDAFWERANDYSFHATNEENANKYRANAVTQGDQIYGLLEYLVDNGAFADAAAAPQWQLTYAFSDIQESLNEIDSRTSFFAADDADFLTLHITGTLQATPVQILTIDTTVTFEKAYPILADYNNNYLEAYLLGSWVDSMGNHWEFSYADDACNEFTFSLTDSSGTVHEGTNIGPWGSSVAANALIFEFNDFYIKDCIIKSFDDKSFVFEYNGGDFILTKE